MHLRVVVFDDVGPLNIEYRYSKLEKYNSIILKTPIVQCEWRSVPIATNCVICQIEGQQGSQENEKM